MQDGATISYGVNPPFLWQHITGHYTNISVTTAGSQCSGRQRNDGRRDGLRRAAAGNRRFKGTIGSLTATLDWKSEGIKETLAANLPVVGNLITGVRTDPAAGTIVWMQAKPASPPNPLSPKAISTSKCSTSWSAAEGRVCRPRLNDLTKKLNDNYPLGIHADSVEVTDSGVVGKFSSQDASIPKEDANPCFARL